MSRHEAPRKVVVGTCIYPMYSSQNPWPELDGRLGQLAGLIDDMAEEAEATYGSGGLDLAALPEVAVNGGLNGDAESVSFPFRGAHVPCRGGGGRMVSSGRMTPARPIGAMIEELGLERVSQVLTRNRALQDEKRPGPVPGR